MNTANRSQFFIHMILFPAAILATLLVASISVLHFGVDEEPRYGFVKLMPPAHTGEPRFMDVAGHTYSKRFRRCFTYGPPSEALISYRRKAKTFMGQLKAKHLKPNFAYQLKLVGTPSDIQSMERLGFTGRWMLPANGTNYDDEAYRRLADKHGAEGYIFFDWFVTDGNGDATIAFSLSSSLHVLQNLYLERMERIREFPAREFTISSFPLWAYESGKRRINVIIQAMSEHYWTKSRAEIGKTFLPEGRYDCLVRLTEESFHGVGGGGFWATALEGKVEFEITTHRTGADE